MISIYPNVAFFCDLFLYSLLRKNQLGAFMAHPVDRLLNLARDVVLGPEEQARRERQIQQLEMIKTAMVATMIVAPIFVIIFPKIIMAILALAAVIGAKEIFTAAGNVLAMVKNVRINLEARATRETLIDQIAKDTWFVKSLISINNPSHIELMNRIDSLGL